MKKETIINTVILNGPLFYFSACALLGIRPDPEEGMGIMYKIYLVSLLLMGFFLWIKGVLKSKNSIAKALPLYILFVYIFVGYLQGFSEHRVFLQMLCFSVPATCVALNIKGREELAEIMKLMDLLLPILSLSFMFMVKNIYLAKMAYGGAYDQTASYLIAYCFLIDIFLIAHENDYPKFKFLDKKWYKMVKFCLLPYFVVLSFFGGGRGAFITIVVGLIFILVRNFKRVSIRKLLRICFGLIILLLLIFFVFGKLTGGYLELFSDNFGRVTSLYGQGGIDTSASSGRDELWTQSWFLIKGKPVIGYGLFSYLSQSNWPHNIFLEVLLQGGIVLFIILIIILILSFSKYRRMLRFDKSQIWLMPLMIYVFTQLFFSGSYMFETYFWFSLSYIYNYRFIKQRRIGMNLMRNSQI